MSFVVNFLKKKQFQRILCHSPFVKFQFHFEKLDHHQDM